MASVAIVGLAGRFPGAPTLERFWRLLADGREAIARFGDDELAADGVPEALRRDPRYVPAKGLLADATRFDAALFGYSAREAELIDPQHRLFLECAREALESAGHDPARFGGAIGVFAGCSVNTYLLNRLAGAVETAEPVGSIQTVVASEKDYLATRVSYCLDLTGPSLDVQAACSTSLAAVHLACRSLLLHECDLALAGGASVRFPRRAGYLYREGQICSPDGHCRPFDRAAAGTVGGEGVGVVALRRLEDALADGDPIAALILGSAINNDGATKPGFTAPGADGQAEVIAQALAVAGVDPATISYVEAHGTATTLGDPAEVAALARAFRTATGPCGLGSVKGNIGHLDAAAGIAGLIKTVLALEHRTLPPSLHFARPHPALGLERSPFYVVDRPTPWGDGDGPRRAGVNAFGMGGTNVHLVLEEAPPRAPSGPAAEWQLLVLSARSRTALDAACRELARHLREHPDDPLADVAWTLQVGRAALPWRRAVLCRDPRRAAELLEEGGEGRSWTAEVRGAGAGAHPGAAAGPDRPALPGAEAGDGLPDEARRLADAAGRWLAGADVDWPALAAGRRRHRLRLPTYPFEHRRYCAEPAARRTPAPEPEPPAERPALADWFHLPSWRRAPLPGRRAPDDLAGAGGWVLFEDAGGVGRALARRLRKAGAQVASVVAGDRFEARGDGRWAVAPGAEGDYRALFAELAATGRPPARIVHLWNLGGADPGLAGPAFARALERSFDSLLCLARSAEPGASGALRVAVVASGLWQVGGTEPVVPARATLLGPAGALPGERPGVDCRVLDLEPAGDDAERERAAERILAELGVPEGAPRVAWRGPHRWLAGLEPWPLAAAPDPPGGLRPQGVYLITGGLGGIGLAVARHLAETARARLVLTGRAGLPPRGEWEGRLAAAPDDDPVARRIRAVRELEAAGAEVLVARADAADEAATGRAIEAAGARFGGLHGVIHAAGMAGGGLMRLRERAAIDRVLAPKVRGGAVLARLLAGRELDFVVLCSSLAALSPPPGQADYAAANAFLDALACSLAGRGPTPWLSVAWDTWAETGMALETGVPAGLEAERRRDLAGGIPTRDGVEALHRLLGVRQPQVVVTPRAGARRHRPGAAPTRPAGNAPDPAAAAARQPRPELATPYAAPDSALERTLAGLWAELLGFDRVGRDDDFFELGGHSLLATELAERVERAVGVAVPLERLFDGPTVAELAAAVAERRGEAGGAAGAGSAGAGGAG